MKILSKLFGSAGKVRVMRLFLFHPLEVLELKEIVRRTKLQSKTARSILTFLKGIGFVRRRTVSQRNVKTLKSGKTKISQKKVRGWVLDSTFPYLSSLRTLLVSDKHFDRKDLASKVAKVGQVKLCIISGIFLGEVDSRVDLLIVVNRINKKKLSELIHSIEVDLGKEVRYSAFSQSEFEYRFKMFDKFVRDVLEDRHEKLVDKIEGLELR